MATPPTRFRRRTRRVLDILAVLAGLLTRSPETESPYLIGNTLTALDVYAATAMAVLAPFPQDLCPMIPEARAALMCFGGDLGLSIPSRLLAHRDFIHQRHLEFPIQL